MRRRAASAPMSVDRLLERERGFTTLLGPTELSPAESKTHAICRGNRRVVPEYDPEADPHLSRSFRQRIAKIRRSRILAEVQEGGHSPRGEAERAPIQSAAHAAAFISTIVSRDHALALKHYFLSSSTEVSEESLCASELCPCRAACGVRRAPALIVKSFESLVEHLQRGHAITEMHRRLSKCAPLTGPPTPATVGPICDQLFSNQKGDVALIVDWPTFMILSSIDTHRDDKKLLQAHKAFRQYVEHKGVRTEDEYLSLVAFMRHDRKAASAKAGGGGGAGGGGRPYSSQSATNLFGPTSASNQDAGGNGRLKTPNAAAAGADPPSFFQPGDSFRVRHLCNFADAVCAMLPHRVQFYLTVSNARGFLMDRNFEGHAPLEGSTVPPDTALRLSPRTEAEKMHDQRKRLVLPPARNMKKVFLEQQTLVVRRNHGVWA